MKKVKNLQFAKTIFIYIILGLGAIWMVLPFLWMFLSSFKDQNSIFTYPPRWFPTVWHFENYIKVWKVVPMGRWFLNSIIVASLATFGNIFGSSLAAYAFAKIKFTGRKGLFLILLGTMMVPYQVIVIPMFLLMKYFGWINTLKPLTIPYFTGSAFGIFLLRQFIMQLPTELFDAAKIDGAGDSTIFLNIVLPLIKPALSTLGLFTFIGSWNDLFNPLIYLYDKDKYTIALGLTYFQGQYSGSWHYLMAGSVIAVLPIVIVFFFTQKYFIKGIKLSGIKI